MNRVDLVWKRQWLEEKRQWLTEEKKLMVVWIFLHFPFILETEDAAAEVAKDRAFLCMGYYCASSRKLNPSAGYVKNRISLQQ